MVFDVLRMIDGSSAPRICPYVRHSSEGGVDVILVPALIVDYNEIMHVEYRVAENLNLTLCAALSGRRLEVTWFPW